MSNDLIFECLSEEVPASEQQKALGHLCSELEKGLKKYNILYDRIEGFYTPVRLVVFIYNLTNTKDSRSYIKGPSTDALDTNVQGFAQKHGHTVSKLQITEVDGKKFYCIPHSKIAIDNAICSLLSAALKSVPWYKQMRWNNHTLRWVRPIHNILCCFQGQALKLTHGHIIANKTTYGHKTMSNSTKEIDSIAEYQDFLQANFVVLNHQQRAEFFYQKLQDFCNTNNLNPLEQSYITINPALSTEFPSLIIIELEENLTAELPAVMVTSVIERHNFIPLYTSGKKLATKTATAINTNANDHIVAGYKQMLKARLLDAIHFWNQTISCTPQVLKQKLEHIAFYDSLGSILEKTQRLTALSKYLSIWIPHANILVVEQAASMAKLDLATEAVKEFPELQGIIGSFYAERHGASHEVVQAIGEHYLPIGMSGDLPNTPVSIALSIADKLDTLVGFFILDKTPTGSGDPFALRRAAISIVRTILHYGLDIPMAVLVHKAIQLYPPELYKAALHTKIVKTINFIAHKSLPEEDKTLDIDHITEKITSFLLERLISLLTSQYDLERNIVLAVTSTNQRISFLQILRHARELADLLCTEDGTRLIACYKRINNISTTDADDNEQRHVRVDLMTSDSELKLLEQAKIQKNVIEKALKHNHYSEAILALQDLCCDTEKFLDQNMVLHEDSAIRENRIALINKLKGIFKTVADFNMLS